MTRPPLEPNSNYWLEVADGHVELGVVRRADLTLEEGTEAGRQMMARLRALIDGDAMRSQLWDMRDGPSAGPRVRAVLETYFEAAAEAGVRSTIVAVHPGQKMLYSRMMAECCGELGAAFTSMASARKFCRGVPAAELPDVIVSLASTR